MTRAQSLLAEMAPSKPNEVADMAAPAGTPIRTATSRIRAALDRAAGAADNLASDAEAVAGGFEATIAGARVVVKDVADADSEMRAAFGLDAAVGNGGPRVDPTVQAAEPQPQGAGSSADSGQPVTEITALGPITRHPT